MDELWRQWPKDQRILVSNKGRIVSCRQSHCRELPIFINDSRYRQTSAGFVHRLVAETWIPKHSGNEVNHIDGDKTNNAVDNLEWTTHSKNLKHAYLEGLHPGHHYPVEIVETGEQFDSQIECAKALHSTKSNISKAVLGKVKKHKGFTIRRVEKS